MSFITPQNRSSLTDPELVAAYRQSGDMEVLGELYSRYMDLVYGVCLKYFKDAERAKDGVMQVFEELVPKLRKHEVENFRGWLHQVAKNHCLMQLRTPRNLKTVEFNGELMQSGENGHLEEVFDREQNLSRMEDCLGQLGAEQQQTIRLFYLEGKCYNEIVEITHIEWGQVRSYIQNGRRNLKNCMEKEITSGTE